MYQGSTLPLQTARVRWPPTPPSPREALALSYGPAPPAPSTSYPTPLLPIQGSCGHRLNPLDKTAAAVCPSQQLLQDEAAAIIPILQIKRLRLKMIEQFAKASQLMSGGAGIPSPSPNTVLLGFGTQMERPPVTPPQFLKRACHTLPLGARHSTTSAPFVSGNRPCYQARSFRIHPNQTRTVRWERNQQSCSGQHVSQRKGQEAQGWGDHSSAWTAWCLTRTEV